MKTTLCIFITILLCTLDASSQSGGNPFIKTPRERATFWVRIMNDSLLLTDCQKEKVLGIFISLACKTDSIRNANNSASQRIKLIRNIITEKELELKEVLTLDQFRKYQELKEIQKQKLKNKLRPNSK